MFCPKCGEKMLVEDAKFCFQCGFDFSALKKEEDTENYDEKRKGSREALIAEEANILEGALEVEEVNATNASEGVSVVEDMIPLIGYAGDDVIYKTPLFDHNRQQHYSAYIKNQKYILYLREYQLSFNQDCIVYSNLRSYMFGGVMETALSNFDDYYKKNVKNMDDWISKAVQKVAEIQEWMQMKAEKFLIASKLYGYDASSLGNLIDLSEFGSRLEAVLQSYADVCENEEQVKLMREMTRSSSSRRFVGGGFGFRGAMGGIMAAGIANAGAGVVGGIKRGVAAIGDEMRANANKRAVFQNPENFKLLQEMLIYEAKCLEKIVFDIIKKETGRYYSVYNDWKQAKTLVVHAAEYTQSEDEFWHDIVQAIEVCPYYQNAYKEIYTRYYKDIELMSQLREVYKLFLLDNVDQKIDALYQEEMGQLFQMPESTSLEVEHKIYCIKEKAEEFRLNEKDELQRLDDVLIDLRKKEAEEEKYLKLLEKNVLEATSIEDLMQEKDFMTIFNMIETGSMIAEERYISYYVDKIRDEENMKLYNSIAANANKHRAYYCIIGICSYYGWGTEKNIEIARHCILKAAELGCTHAKAFIGMIYLQELTELTDKKQAKTYIDELIVLASPTMLYYLGKAFSFGKAKGGSDFMKNNYDSAVLYLEYAQKCHMKEAKENLDNVRERGKEKVNEETYGSSDGCYITTATCKYLGKSDDCYELEKFREYRDKILIRDPDGEDLIKEYYQVAPQIVKNVDNMCNSKEIYFMIWNEYLKPCLRFLECGEYANCKDLYVKMVKKMQIQYLYMYQWLR